MMTDEAVMKERFEQWMEQHKRRYWTKKQKAMRYKNFKISAGWADKFGDGNPSGFADWTEDECARKALSHWCVFNSRYCQQVAETWESEFRKAPCDRRKSLLYLANDIMQNTRKDSDGGYIAEFMRVIPDALNEVYDTGDDSGRMAVKRLVDTPCGVEKRDHDSLGEPTMSDEQSKLPEAEESGRLTQEALDCDLAEFTRLHSPRRTRMEQRSSHTGAATGLPACMACWHDGGNHMALFYSDNGALAGLPNREDIIACVYPTPPPYLPGLGTHDHCNSGPVVIAFSCSRVVVPPRMRRPMAWPSWRPHLNSAVAIWEDRKIFDSQEQSVKNGYLRRLKDLRNKLEKSEELLEKVVFNYKHVLNATKDEDNLLQKCKASIGIFDNLNAAYENNSYLDNSSGSRFVEELQEQRSIIRNSIEKLKVSQSLRNALISHLKEALYDQEISNVCSIMTQEAQERYKKANEICQNLGIDVEEHQPTDQGLKRSTFSETFVKCFTHSDVGKRQKVENGTCISQPQSQPPSPPPPPPPFPHPDTLQQPPPPPVYPYSPEPPLAPPPTSAAHNIIPPPPLAPVPHYIISPISPITGPFVPFPVGPAGGLVTGMPYGNFSSYPPAVNFPMANMPPRFPSAPNPPPAFRGSQGMFYGPPPYPTALPPMYRG
ncbi:hypothetical protein EJB05_54239, partial [Eragrostis curvula]